MDIQHIAAADLFDAVQLGAIALAIIALADGETELASKIAEKLANEAADVAEGVLPIVRDCIDSCADAGVSAALIEVVDLGEKLVEAREAIEARPGTDGR